jgi:hypothetical protein
MKRISLTIITVFCSIGVFIIFNSCKKDTATVSFVNHSVTNSTYNVQVNGSTLCQIAPGATSSTFTIQSGVTYNFQFYVSTGTVAVCADTYNPTPGQSESYSCSF